VPNIVRFDCYEVDLSSGQLYKQGTRINLREKSFEILAALLESPGELVTREELRHRLWREDVFVDFDNNLNTAIGRLREALSDSAEHPRFIETLPRRGYRFIGALTSSGAPQCTSRPRLLVLPFLNLGGNPADEYFSDAMTDEIITAFASLAPKQLAVIARTTAMHYKGSHKDVATIARELRVDYVLEGGLRRTQEQVSANVQLIQTSDQTHLFAKKFDAPIAAIFHLQDSIAHAVGQHIPGVAADVSRRASAGIADRANPTEDVVAYHFYLRGRQYLHSANFLEARRCFEQALACDPQLALAYDGVAELHWWAGFSGLVPPREAFAAGLWAAMRAVEIDNTLAETHALLGIFRKELDYNWPEVQREMMRALELNPASPIVRFRYAISGLMPHGRLAESISELETLLEADPLEWQVRLWLAVMHWLKRDYDRGLDEVDQILELDPTYQPGHLVRGEILTARCDYPEAITALRRAVELAGGSPLPLGWLGLALSLGGYTSEARELLSRLHQLASQAYIPATSFAWIHLGLGEFEEAFGWMDRAVEQRDPMMIPVKTYPFFDPLREDPRFQALVRKMNLTV
jgi:serine/threonine-protein kinase